MNVYVAEFISILIALSALAIVRVRDLFALMVLLSAYSALLAIMFALLGAVDVSFTEAVVGTGVSTVFIMALIWRVNPNELSKSSYPKRIFAFFIAIFVGGVVVYGSHALPPFGDVDAPGHQHISPDYIAKSIPLIQTPNVVTAVLADFRSFDTLIEATVVLTAALACLLVLGRSDDPSL
jgi:multicomponent Na+:H+ antiporter subunit B